MCISWKQLVYIVENNISCLISSYFSKTLHVNMKNLEVINRWVLFERIINMYIINILLDVSFDFVLNNDMAIILWAAATKHVTSDGQK